MDKYQISPTLLEQWRLTKLGAYNKDGQSFIDYIMKPFEMNEAASRGLAYHEMIENGPDQYKKHSKEGADFYQVHEPKLGRYWNFSQEAVEPIQQVRSQHKHLVFESWNTYKVIVNGCKIVIKMRLDGLQGLRLHEFKSTGRSGIRANKADGTGYLDSIQHKAYLASLKRLRSCTYHIFKLNKMNSKCDYYQFTYLRTGKEEQEVIGLTAEMITWLANHHPQVLQKLSF